MSGARTLYVLYRRIPLGEIEAYDARWAAVAAAAKSCGVNSWRFQQAEDRAERLEFLEGAESFTLAGHPQLDAALRALDADHPPKPGFTPPTPWKETPTT
jgi:hypothetical protein